MRTRSALAPGAINLGKKIADISHEANKKLKWFDYYEGHGRNARETCRHFGISPDTFYFWRKRYQPGNLRSLEEKSHRPKRLRQPTWDPQTAEEVKELRELYPRWGKAKLVYLLKEKGIFISESMVGRIIKQLKTRGELREPIPNYISTRKRSRQRPYAIRKPKEYQAKVPGDIIQVDTMDVRPLPGIILKHFAARDVISRWDVMKVSSKATAASAARFIENIIKRMPFPVKALQVDGGSEFQSIFEETCERLGIRLFVLPPRSPKLNGYVERSNRTHTEEFYEVTDCEFDIESINKALIEWEKVYNLIRPHQSLGYLTPAQFLKQNFSILGKEKVYGIK